MFRLTRRSRRGFTEDEELDKGTYEQDDRELAYQQALCEGQGHWVVEGKAQASGSAFCSVVSLLHHERISKCCGVLVAALSR